MVIKPHDLLVPGKLHTLPHFHTRPINLVIFEGSLGAEARDIQS